MRRFTCPTSNVRLPLHAPRCEVLLTQQIGRVSWLVGLVHLSVLNKFMDKTESVCTAGKRRHIMVAAAKVAFSFYGRQRETGFCPVRTKIVLMASNWCIFSMSGCCFHLFVMVRDDLYGLKLAPAKYALQNETTPSDEDLKGYPCLSGSHQQA